MIFNIQVICKDERSEHSAKSMREVLDWVFKNETLLSINHLKEIKVYEDKDLIFTREWEVDMDAGVQYLVWRAH